MMVSTRGDPGVPAHRQHVRGFLWLIVCVFVLVLTVSFLWIRSHHAQNRSARVFSAHPSSEPPSSGIVDSSSATTPLTPFVPGTSLSEAPKTVRDTTYASVQPKTVDDRTEAYVVSSTVQDLDYDPSSTKRTSTLVATSREFVCDDQESEEVKASFVSEIRDESLKAELSRQFSSRPGGLAFPDENVNVYHPKYPGEYHIYSNHSMHVEYDLSRGKSSSHVKEDVVVRSGHDGRSYTMRNESSYSVNHFVFEPGFVRPTEIECTKPEVNRTCHFKNLYWWRHSLQVIIIREEEKEYQAKAERRQKQLEDEKADYFRVVPIRKRMDLPIVSLYGARAFPYLPELQIFQTWADFGKFVRNYAFGNVDNLPMEEAEQEGVWQKLQLLGAREGDGTLPVQGGTGGVVPKRSIGNLIVFLRVVFHSKSVNRMIHIVHVVLSQ